MYYTIPQVSFRYFPPVPVSGIQGQDIGDVKFNQDGDAMGRYSVYQYQQVENTHDPKGETRFVRSRYVRHAHILIEYVFRSRILGRNPDKSLKSFPPCYTESSLQLCLMISISSNSRNLL
jgi:hypothetical protein